jgi:hypothetical protein
MLQMEQCIKGGTNATNLMVGVAQMNVPFCHHHMLTGLTTTHKLS